MINWIARFGTSARITTDQGRQFELDLFKKLTKLTGSVHIRTTAYYSAANGMIERFHRQLKASIKSHQTKEWADILSVVLMGLRASWKKDLQATPAEMVFAPEEVTTEQPKPTPIPLPSSTPTRTRSKRISQLPSSVETQTTPSRPKADASVQASSPKNSDVSWPNTPSGNSVTPRAPQRKSRGIHPRVQEETTVAIRRDLCL
ncbi:uncharacterized protein LOC105839333 [Monomorium pharaonis]|uniref:uncharacterized protein LOC105839333 n=1 Tax=Monomorium pharaonis TaxID=307658 RepID=UPI00063F66A8|nr:uncharacterized protein LOC105839333 [Monomorium pharaonis]